VTIMPRYPTLFQINALNGFGRLSDQSRKMGHRADIDDATLEASPKKAFDWILVA
jgi:hypothetical protein